MMAKEVFLGKKGADMEYLLKIILAIIIGGFLLYLIFKTGRTFLK